MNIIILSELNFINKNLCRKKQQQQRHTAWAENVILSHCCFSCFMCTVLCKINFHDCFNTHTPTQTHFRHNFLYITHLSYSLILESTIYHCISWQLWKEKIWMKHRTQLTCCHLNWIGQLINAVQFSSGNVTMWKSFHQLDGAQCVQMCVVFSFGNRVN